MSKQESYLIVDEYNREKRLGTREQLFDEGIIHRGVHLILLNSKEEMLLQKRAPDKKWFPNLYTFSVSGTVEHESYQEAIQRETEEEIGIKVSPQFLFEVPFFWKNDFAFHAIFLAKSDATIIPDKREIAAIRWISLDELKQEIKEHPEQYTPAFVAAMKIFFQCFWKK